MYPPHAYARIPHGLTSLTFSFKELELPNRIREAWSRCLSASTRAPQVNVELSSRLDALLDPSQSDRESSPDVGILQPDDLQAPPTLHGGVRGPVGAWRLWVLRGIWPNNVYQAGVRLTLYRRICALISPRISMRRGEH